MSIFQRYRDWRHERHIHALGESCRISCEMGDKREARALWRDMVRAIEKRSPQQIARMNKRIGVA